MADDDTLPDLSRQLHRIRRENRALFTRLLEGEKRFRQLAKAVWMVQEDERRRLARELHDGIGQTLTALKNQLEIVRRSDSLEEVPDCIELVSTALNDTRELSRLLRPAILDDLGLDPALRWLARTLGKRAAMRFNVHCDLGEQRLPADIETLVFRVVQEGLTNVIKYAQVPEADIRVTTDASYLRVSIRDEGQGFDTSDIGSAEMSEQSLGLRGMRDRVELFEGRLAVTSQPGKGCTLELAIPMPHNNENSQGE